MNENPYTSPGNNPTPTSSIGRTMRLKRIGVLQAGKLLAVLNLLLSLVIVVPMMFFVMAAGSRAGDGSAGVAAGMGVIGIIFVPVFYAIGGFIGGIICAFLYNLVAGWIGGLELEFSKN